MITCKLTIITQFNDGNDSDQLWLWNEDKATMYFPDSDGKFDLQFEDVRGSQFFVELPDTNQSGHSTGTSHLCRCKPEPAVACVSTQHMQRCRWSGGGIWQNRRNTETTKRNKGRSWNTPIGTKERCGYPVVTRPDAKLMLSAAGTTAE